MLRRIGLLAAAVLMSGCAPAPIAGPLTYLSPDGPPIDAVFHARVAAEVSAARTDPRTYARKLRILRGWYRGDRIEQPGEIPIVTREGVAAVDEAIAFLEAQPSLPAVARSQPLDRAAAGHAADQARSGRTGHGGEDGLSPHERMVRFGRWAATAEAIAYGPDTAEAMVVQLIVDDGVPDRGHRRILFNPAYTLIGVGCGPHPEWRRMCVLDFARPADVSP